MNVGPEYSSSQCKESLKKDTPTPIKQLQAIDVHAHVGIYAGDKFSLINQFMTADADTIVRRARMANTQLTIFSPNRALIPRFKGDPIAGNEEAARIVEEKEGLLQWVVVDPLKPKTYTQAAEMLGRPKCPGIKIHPEEHGYPIKDHGTAIFEFATEHNAIVLTHSGEKNSLPEDFVKIANDFPNVRLILAHLGCGWDGDPAHQVRAIQASKHGNVFVDTSSAKNVMPGLIEWAVKEIGAEKILYGTDSPCYFSPMQRARIDNAEIEESQKRKILRDNAVSLFGLKDLCLKCKERNE